MAEDLKAAIERSLDTLAADALGAATLVVILCGGLALPHLF